MIVNQVEKSNTKQEEDSPRKKKMNKGEKRFFPFWFVAKKNVFDFTFFFVQDDTPKETTK